MSEAEQYDATIYERPSVTVDVVILTLINEALHVLLLQRRHWPYAGQWAIPGGFVGIDESLEDAAQRELQEETGIQAVYLEQLYTFGSPQRDPRTRVISVAYFALVRADRHQPSTSDEATAVRWFPIDQLPEPLAFDHRVIVQAAVNRLRSKLEYTTLAFQLLPEEFTLAELYETYGQLFGDRRRGDDGAAGEWAGLDKRNFYRKITDAGILHDTGRFREGRGRPAKLYTFRPETQSGEFVFRWREARAG
ncbi:MAG: NUDIX hydrolase [Herpetosiphonaceae bacterium]|nr:NUDIX hydrolase [Herpetosiphonaceae bacterium]